MNTRKIYLSKNKKIMDMDQEMLKVRKILWKEFDTIIPDETVKLIIYSFKMMAKIIVRDFEKENERERE